MKKINRIISCIAAAAMMSVCIPATVSQAAAAADDGNGIYALNWNAFNSKSGYFDFSGVLPDNIGIKIAKSVSSDDTTESTISYSFDINETNANRGYDVWVLCTINAGNNISRPYISFDKGDKTAIPDSLNGWDNSGSNAVSPRTYPLLGASFNLNWCKAAENVTFATGTHTLDYTVGKRVQNDYVATCYGGAMLVPSSYNWVPTAMTDVKPGNCSYDTNFDHSYAWIELEDYNKAENIVETNRYFDTASADLSGYGGIRKHYMLTGHNVESTFEYDFALDKDDTYDIYYLGTGYATHLSWFEYSFDNNPLQNAGQPITSTEALYTFDSQNVKWNKIASNISLSQGTHSMKFKLLLRSLDGNYCMSLSDAIAIVPSGANWTPTTADKSVQGRVNLDAHMLAYNLGNNAVTESADIPKMGAAGSRYSYTSSDENVIGNDLTVYREKLYNKTCELTPTLTQAAVTETASPISVTVMRTSPYSIRDLKVTDAAGQNVSALVTGATITASAQVYDDVSENKSGAVIILALYDSEWRCVKCAMDSIAQMTETEQEIKAELTIPENAVKAKVYVWDGMTNLNALTDSMEIPQS